MEIIRQLRPYAIIFTSYYWVIQKTINICISDLTVRLRIESCLQVKWSRYCWQPIIIINTIHVFSHNHTSPNGKLQTANCRLKLGMSQNRKWADKNSVKQLLWMKITWNYVFLQKKRTVKDMKRENLVTWYILTFAVCLKRYSKSLYINKSLYLL